MLLILPMLTSTVIIHYLCSIKHCMNADSLFNCRYWSINKYMSFVHVYAVYCMKVSFTNIIVKFLSMTLEQILCTCVFVYGKQWKHNFVLSKLIAAHQNVFSLPLHERLTSLFPFNGSHSVTCEFIMGDKALALSHHAYTVYPMIITTNIFST